MAQADWLGEVGGHLVRWAAFISLVSLVPSCCGTFEIVGVIIML